MIALEGFGLFSLHSIYSNANANSNEEFTTLSDLGEHGRSVLSQSTSNHSFFFMILSCAMTLVAWMRLVSLDNLYVCLGYSIIFAYVSTKAMIDWAFPLHTMILDLNPPYIASNIHGDDFIDSAADFASVNGYQEHQHIVNSAAAKAAAAAERQYLYPFVFLYVLKVLNTFVSLWNPKNYHFNLSFSYYFPLIYYITISWPIVNLLVSYIFLENSSTSPAASGDDQDPSSHQHVVMNKYNIYNGIILSTLMGNVLLTCSFRLKEILNYMSNRMESISTSRFMIPTLSFMPAADTKGRDRGGLTGVGRGGGGECPLVLFSVYLTIFWIIVAMLFQVSEVDYDLLFPVGAAIIFIYDQRIEFSSTWVAWLNPFSYFTRRSTSSSAGYSYTPIEFWCLVISYFWYFSAFYHIFIYDFPVERYFSSSDTGSSSYDANKSIFYEKIIHSISLKPYSYFKFDSNISIWSPETSTWIVVLNLGTLLLTYPVLYVSLWYGNSVFHSWSIASGIAVTPLHSSSSSNGSGSHATISTVSGGWMSEESLFLFAILSIISIIGSSIDCIRYLGIMSLVLGSLTSYRLTQKKKDANRFI
jgi:hypothetical protein